MKFINNVIGTSGVDTVIASGAGVAAFLVAALLLIKWLGRLQAAQVAHDAEMAALEAAAEPVIIPGRTASHSYESVGILGRTARRTAPFFPDKPEGAK